MVGPSAQQLLRKGILETQYWHWVRVKANSDPVLKEMLDEIKTYTALKYDYKVGKNGNEN